jgi:hypothetical protein
VRPDKIQAMASSQFAERRYYGAMECSASENGGRCQRCTVTEVDTFTVCSRLDAVL